MVEKEYIILCDESDRKGKYFSNFYAGVMVGGSQYERITARLNDLKAQLNLHGEVKWAKTTERYLEKYQHLVKGFFEEIRSGNLRVRVMFTQNAYAAQGLTKEHVEMEYFILYYHFIKLAFGLQHLEPRLGGTRIRLYFDQFPHTGEKVEQFKGYLLGLRRVKAFQNARIVLTEDNITEVRSHDHVLLQCLDVVLGSISFRLNDKHKNKPAGQRIRGKRTRAKEQLYKLIHNEICRIRPNFNVGVSTGLDSGPLDSLIYPYAHWCFRPTRAQYDGEKTKRNP